MSFEIEISGNISREDVDKLRRQLPGAKVILFSGFGGERVLTIIGSLAAAQIVKIREFVLLILGEDRIENLKISKDSVEIGKVPVRSLPAVEEAVAKLLDLLKD